MTKEQMREELKKLGVPLKDTEGLLHKQLETLLEDTREDAEIEEKELAKLPPKKGVRVLDVNNNPLTFPNKQAAEDYVKHSGGKIVV